MSIPDETPQANEQGREPPSANGGLPSFDPDFAIPADWAAMYRAAGLQVVPCYSPSEAPAGSSWKRPRLSEWQNLGNELAPQYAFLRWYGRKGEHSDRRNMGIIMGRASGNLMDIDLDTHKNPAAGAWWQALIEVENSGIDLETVEQRTGGGGTQKLFRCPVGWTVPTNRTDIGVDIRGQLGFAVVAPSLHDSGGSYDWLPGRAPWEIPIADAPGWLLDAVTKLVGSSASQPKSKRTQAPGSDYDAFGNRQDGREEYMARVVWAAVVDLYRDSPIKPLEGLQRSHCQKAYEVYEGQVISRLAGEAKTAGLDAEGRGPAAFWVKYQAAMKHWEGKVAQDAAQPRPGGDKSGHFDPHEFEQSAHKAEDRAKSAGKTLELLDVKEIKAMPDPIWLVDGIVIEQSLGFIYGPPGSLKTFIALDLALCFATGQSQWWNRSIARKGAVVYISTEGHAKLKFRIMAWEKNRQVPADDAPFYLMRQTINFMDPKDVGLLLATVEAAAVRAGCPIAAVFVDTVSRVLPGAEENQQKDMTIFVQACDQVRERFKTVVVGIHHTNKEGGFRGSTVMPGAGDFLVEVRRETGAMVGSIYASKVKDADDGWDQQFKVTELAVGPMAAHTSLAVDADPGKAAAGAAPDATGYGRVHRDTLRQILAAIDEAWREGKPWRFSKNSSLCASVMITKRWRLKRKEAEEMLSDWTANGLIVEDIFSSKNHIKGYRKLADL